MRGMDTKLDAPVPVVDDDGTVHLQPMTVKTGGRRRRELTIVFPPVPRERLEKCARVLLRMLIADAARQLGIDPGTPPWLAPPSSR
jgi:hypothetical protein